MVGLALHGPVPPSDNPKEANLKPAADPDRSPE